MRPQKQAAADFIIDTVKKHPGEVTIVAIGSAANLAAALDKAPEIAPLAKRVVYMAGAFFIPHWNTTGKIELLKCCS